MTEELFYIPTKKYVYFDDKGEISSISNSNSLEGNFIEVAQEVVINILKGIDQPSAFCVTYDTLEKKHIFKRKATENNFSVIVNDNMYNIPFIGDTIDYDIKLMQDFLNQEWRLVLHNGIKYNLLANASFYDTILYFSITKKNDPHELYHYFTVTINDLLQHDEIKIPFKSQFELDKSDISVYTFKKFNVYCRGVIND
jgi:hypothetical protein